MIYKPRSDIYFLVGLALGLSFSRIEYSRIEYTDIILKSIAEQATRHYHLDVTLLFVIVGQESQWNPNAISPNGAIGFMQIMPETGEVECGLRLKSVELALCAYNCRVAQLQHCPRIRETIEYSRNILKEGM